MRAVVGVCRSVKLAVALKDEIRDSRCSSGTAAGIDPAAALSSFNAYPLFDKLGDAIITGPTGNNVRDLRIFLAF